YRELLATHTEEVLAEGLPASYPRPLAAALRVSMGELAKDEAAVHLLRLCAVLAPEPIPMGLLTADPASVPDPLGTVLANPMRSYSTAKRVGGGLARVSQHGIHLHRLVQVLVRSRLTDDERGDLLRQATSLLVASRPGDPA